MENKKKNIIKALESHNELFSSFNDEFLSEVERVANELNKCFKRGNKLLIFGNGGSAADAQHISAEFVGRFVMERQPLPSIALTTDTSALTAISNDYEFDKIFERQILALAKNGDIVLGITTSGNSLNVIRGLETAKSLNCVVISLTGRNGGRAREISDLNINISSYVTARIQEAHIFVGHVLCELVDQQYGNI